MKIPSIKTSQSTGGSIAQLVFSTSWNPNKAGSNVREGIHLLASQEQESKCFLLPWPIYLDAQKRCGQT